MAQTSPIQATDKNKLKRFCVLQANRKLPATKMKQKKNLKKAVFLCPFFKLLKSVEQKLFMSTNINIGSTIEKFSNVIIYTPFPKKFF